jgi:hypothetical protein
VMHEKRAAHQGAICLHVLPGCLRCSAGIIVVAEHEAFPVDCQN